VFHVDSPSCIDEEGVCRLNDESWYGNGDPCMICSCSSGSYR